MSVAAVDLSAFHHDAITRKYSLQDVAGKIRLFTLPTQGPYRLTVGPGFDSTGIANTTGRIDYSVVFAATYTNNASAPSVADAAKIGSMFAGESREFQVGVNPSNRPVEIVIWSTVNNDYVEITMDSVGSR